ncbi:unnamed protein product, partial [Brachionus calyciflorus]
SDLELLITGKKLNDIIINFYLKLLCNSSSLGCSTIDSLIVNKILASNLRGLSKCLEKFSKQSFKLLFCPVLREKSHWALIIFDVVEKTIGFFDSIFEPDFEIIRSLSINLGKYLSALSGSENWKISEQDLYPKQFGNNLDCGVFVCTYAKFIAFQQDLNFNQYQMTQIRETIANEILNFEIDKKFTESS